MPAALTLNDAEHALAASLPDGEVATALREQGLPTRRDEAWRWSDLRAKETAARSPSAEMVDPKSAGVMALADRTEILFANGRLVTDPSSLPEGVTLTVAPALFDLDTDEIVAALGSAAPLVVVRIDGSQAALTLRYLADGDGYHAQNVSILIAAGSHLDLLEVHEVTGAPFVNARTMIDVGRAARLVRTIAQPAAPSATLVHYSEVSLQPKAKLRQVSVARGAALARHQTHLSYFGAADVRLGQLYRLEDTAHCDFTTHADLLHPDSQTRHLCKGVIDGRARGVFQGKFYVARPAQHTDAQMAHHALLLSDDASVNAKPELEIYADDVECAHGNTAGALDEDALFYLQQRGLSADEARRLLIDAFGAEVLDRVDGDAMRDALAAVYGGGA